MPCRPLQLISGPGACEHRGAPTRDVWKYSPLKDFELGDNMFDVKTIERVLQSIHSDHNAPANKHVVWHMVSREGMFWAGNPVDRPTRRLFVKGDWPNSKPSRFLEIGRLKCGYRSNLI